MKSENWALKIFCGSIYLFLYLPIGVMMAFSFNNAQRNVAWRGFTLAWYSRLFKDSDLFAALSGSVELALLAALLSVVLAVLASYAIVRHPDFKGGRAYAGLLNVPMMLPEVVLGVGLLLFFVRAHIRLSFWTLVLAHVVFCLPYAAGSIRARLLSLKNANLEEAAMDLGASEWQAFYKVTLPLLGPAIFSGALLSFTVSFEDFVTSFFVAGVGVTTLPIRIYSMMKFGITPQINALATLMLLLTLTVLGAYHWLAGDSAASD